MTSIFRFIIINEIENLGNWQSTLGKQNLRITCPKGIASWNSNIFEPCIGYKMQLQTC